MFKKYTLFTTLFLITLFVNKVCFAVSEAGEKQTDNSSSPYADITLTQNITDLPVPTKKTEENKPIDFSADMVINDEKQSLITASGNVELLYDGMKLQTDNLSYNQNTDIITAKGNVKLYATDGSVIYSDEINLSEKMSVGEMQNIKVILKDESRIFAKSFYKKNNQTKSLRQATYTPCNMCANKKPLWSISARKIQHDEKEKNMNYNDAYIKFKDIPVFYMPFFSHPDPTVKRRSGLLPPSFGSSNYLGAILQPRYFWAVNNHTNLLLSPIISSDKGIILGGEYKQYFMNGNTSVSGTYLKDNNENRPKDRGNLFAKGRYDINQNWRMKYDFKYVTDYIYLKELSLPYQDDAWLTSDVKFERFDNRNYSAIDIYYYKLLSYNLHQSNKTQFEQINREKPLVAPLFDVEIYSSPHKNGSYFKNQFNGASVYHNNGMQTQRLTSINSWELPYTSQFGERYRFVASIKSDLYYVNKYQNLNNNYTGTTARFFPQLGMEWRLPLVKATENSRQIIEPVIVAVISPNGGNKANKIPNEDSEDVYFDDTNVLDLNRYAGYDRNDTGSRISYGFNWNSYNNFMGRTSAFIAQSYEFNKDSSFIESLDTSNKSNLSDYVGRINAEPNKYLNLNYRFRLDKKTLDAKYSEFNIGFGPSFLRGNISYIFLQGNTYYNELYSERKELYTSISSAFSENWSFSIYNLQDLTDKSKGSLEHGGSLIYEDECFKWVTAVKKYNSSNPDLENNYEFGVTFYLKTVGAFGS